MKTHKNIIINIDKHLGVLTLDRQGENNSLNIETSKEIYEGLQELEMNSSVRVILIKGNQKFFSPGADIKELSNLNTKSAHSKGLFNFFDKIKEINVPIIAAVEGYALGGGMELALLCDIIIACKDSRFGQPEVNLGLVPGIGGTQRLKHSLGKYNANYLCMSGEIISGTKAYKLGLVSVLLDKVNFLEEVIKVAKQITEKPKSSLIEIKKLIGNDYLPEKGFDEERKSFYSLLNSENAKEGISSFLNKKKPTWKD
ncbi:enoyl-CoA hydratase/isomerase family protein [Pelagibacteraceae bacterium]|nr:enoyl-CoA hydratase/isomerase family protein [Pelagibacteraceae bacterium]